jgi:tetratricopeptide (TPR) repeat protein
MKLRSVSLALGLLLAAAAGPALAQYENASRAAPPPAPPEEDDNPNAKPAQAQGQNDVKASPQALKALIELQKAVTAKDTANIPAKLAAAQAAAKTKEDRYLIGRLQLRAAIDANDNAATNAAIAAIEAAGVADRGQVAQLYKGMGGTFYNAKQYDQAITAFNKAVSLNPNDFESLDLIAESQLASGHKAEASAAYLRSIQARGAAGQKASEDVYQKAVQLAYDAKAPNAVQVAREWVAAYPSANSWHNAVAIYRNLGSPDTEGTLDLLRLLQANGALTTSGDYALFVEAAADQMNFNEAKAVLDAGIAAKVVDPAKPQFRDMITVLNKKQIATAADLETALKSSPAAANMLRIGDRYYAMGNYSKAADIYRQVAAKPGADKDVANLHLGMALARAGDKAGATAALNSVTGGRAEVAKFWLLYLQKHA